MIVQLKGRKKVNTYSKDVSLGHGKPLIHLITNLTSYKCVVKRFALFSTIKEGQHTYLLRTQHELQSVSVR